MNILRTYACIYNSLGHIIIVELKNVDSMARRMGYFVLSVIVGNFVCMPCAWCVCVSVCVCLNSERECVCVCVIDGIYGIVSAALILI